jgi:hypothetical protein
MAGCDEMFARRQQVPIEGTARVIMPNRNDHGIVVDRPKIRDPAQDGKTQANLTGERGVII